MNEGLLDYSMNTDNLFLTLKKQKLVYFVAIIFLIFGIICIFAYICSHAMLHNVSYKYEAENLYSTVGNITSTLLHLDRIPDLR